jgi:cytochrome c oxidase assembly factor 1
VVRQIMRSVRENEDMHKLLGDAIRPEPLWYLNGDPWINGRVIAIVHYSEMGFES